MKIARSPDIGAPVAAKVWLNSTMILGRSTLGRVRVHGHAAWGERNRAIVGSAFGILAPDVQALPIFLGAALGRRIAG